MCDRDDGLMSLRDHRVRGHRLLKHCKNGCREGTKWQESESRGGVLARRCGGGAWAILSLACFLDHTQLAEGKVSLWGHAFSRWQITDM